MPLLDELMQYQSPLPPAGTDINLRPGQAYASFYPQWETQTPQYPTPAIYPTIQTGYRQNEFVYSIIQKRADAVAQAPIRFWDDSGETAEEMEDFPGREFLDNINQFLPESAFWGVSEISRCVAGFAAWEIETTNGGDPLRAWFMRPDWCSFIRGQQKPMAFIRYQPYGLPPVDIPIERVCFMFSPTENFDPLYPFIRFLSPSAIALPQIRVDNGMTVFLDNFIRRGARFGGLISVAQTLAEDGAKDIQRRWVEHHGGTENWSYPLVLGQGADYKQMQMNFDDMAFPELDARTETRICNTFNIDPIVANARAGLDVSSYNNKTQATKDWYYGWGMSTWKMYASQFGQQMLPRWGKDPKKFYCEFYLEDIYQLADDKAKLNTFWLDAAKANKITTNEFRERVRLDPLDDPEADKLSQPQLSPFGNNGMQTDQNNSGGGSDTETGGKTPQAATSPKELSNQAQTEEEKVAKQDEVTKFRRFAKSRIKENKGHLLASYEFKFLDLDEQAKLLAEFGVSTEQKSDLLILAEAINNAANKAND